MHMPWKCGHMGWGGPNLWLWGCDSGANLDERFEYSFSLQGCKCSLLYAWGITSNLIFWVGIKYNPRRLIRSPRFPDFDFIKRLSALLKICQQFLKFKNLKITGKCQKCLKNNVLRFSQKWHQGHFFLFFAFFSLFSIYSLPPKILLIRISEISMKNMLRFPVT